MYSLSLSAVFVLYSGICGRAVVRDDLSPESVESPENDICDRNDVDGTDFGSIREPGVCKDDFFIKESGKRQSAGERSGIKSRDFTGILLFILFCNVKRKRI